MIQADFHLASLIFRRAARDGAAPPLLNKPGDRYGMPCGRFLKCFFGLSLPVVIGIAVWAVTSAPSDNSIWRVGHFALAFVIVAAGTWTYTQYFLIEIGFNERGVFVKKPLVPVEDPILWESFEQVRYYEISHALMLRSRTGYAIQVSSGRIGFVDFCRVALRHLPAAAAHVLRVSLKSCPLQGAIDSGLEANTADDSAE